VITTRLTVGAAVTVIVVVADCPPPVTVMDVPPAPAPVIVTAAPVVEPNETTAAFAVDHVRGADGSGLLAESNA
jgi:hypothetical protein